jgi:HlyD family secretion protein
MCETDKTRVAVSDSPVDASLQAKPMLDEQRRRRLWRYGRQAAKAAVVVAAVGVGIYWMAFAPMAVRPYCVRSGDIVAEVMGTGTLEARVKSTISPKISGRIEEISVDQGDRVKAGQPIVRLNDEELKRQVEIAEAGVSVTQAAIERLKATKEAAVASAEQAKRERDRGKRLIGKGAISTSDLEKAIETATTAESSVICAESAITEARQQIVAAEKTLAFHRAQLSDTLIAAPFDGLIVRRQHDPGDVVSTGSSILLLVSTNVLWISAWVDETELARVHEGQPVRVVFRAEPDHSYEGRVTRLGRETDRETRECTVDVRVLKLPENWAVGQRAEIYIATGRKHAVPLLPSGLVVWHESHPGVFIDSDGRASWRDVTLGARSRDMVEVVEGLRPGDTVVVPTDAAAKLEAGRRIARDDARPLKAFGATTP